MRLNHHRNKLLLRLAVFFVGWASVSLAIYGHWAALIAFPTLILGIAYGEYFVIYPDKE